MDPISRDDPEARKHAVSKDDHHAVLERLRAEIEAVPADAFGEPTLPIAVHLDEAARVAMVAAQHREELLAVGMPGDLVDRLARYVTGLRSAQALWLARRSEQAGDVAAKLVAARSARADGLAMARLGLRNHPAVLAKLRSVASGKKPAELIMALDMIGHLLAKHRKELAAIRVDGKQEEARLAAAGAALQEARFARTEALQGDRLKETRDRLFALGQATVREIRAYARFAFRNDASPERLALFGSDYVRERNRKQKRRLKALRAATPGPGDG